MFDTPITIVGNIVNDPQGRRVGDQEVIKFRVASNSRRRTADGSWEAGNSLYVTVNCWGRLVTGVGAALRKGDPVIAVGYVYTSEYEDRDGNRRSTLEMRATAVGPDLSRSLVRIVEKIRPERDASPVRSSEASARDDMDDDDADADDGDADGEAVDDADGEAVDDVMSRGLTVSA